MKTNREKETEKSLSNNATPFKDCPITGLKDDKLCVSSYVEGITEFIRTCETPMTIAIQGEWGSGKTSFMNMIKEKLSKDNFNEDNLIFVNVWKYAQFCDEKNIARAVLSGVLSELKADKILKRNFRRIGKVFGSVIEIVTDATVGGKAGDAVGNLTKTVTDEPATTTLQKAINKSVDKCLKKSNKERIVFFIDDLDRLKPIQAIEVLEIIKNYLDIEQCVFLLAIDYDVIIDGVKEKYGNDFSTNKAHQFFEKIIQVPFYIPKQSYEIANYLKILSNSEKVDEKVKSILEYSVGKNPRAIKRAMNILKLTKLINANEKDKEKKIINVKDDELIAIICLQLCYNEIYDEMLKNTNEWQEAFNIKTKNVVDKKFREAFHSLFEKEDDKEKIKRLLKLAQVTDFETDKTKKEEYYVKLNIENEETRIRYFKKGGHMKSGIPALNYLLINSYKNELGNWYNTNICMDTNLKELKAKDKNKNKFWLFDSDAKDNGKTFNSDIYDVEVLSTLRKVLGENLEEILCGSEDEAEKSKGINVTSNTWTYFIEDKQR